MKIRTGFVSNSSSSSFIVAGIYFDSAEELHEQLVKHFGNEVAQTEEFEGGCRWAWAEKLEYDPVSSKVFKPLSVIGDYENGIFYIGKPIHPEYISFSQLKGEIPFLSEEDTIAIEKVSLLFSKPPSSYFHEDYC